MYQNKCITLLILLFAINTFAQLNTFQLYDYKIPQINRHRISAVFDFQSNSYYSSNAEESSYNKIEISSNENRFKSYISTNYNLIYNSVKLQSNTDITYNIKSDFIISKQDHSYESDESSWDYKTDIENDAYIESYNRFYSNNTLFIETDVNLDINEYRLHVSTPILAGYGRIDDVQDANIAVDILKALRKKNCISDTVTHKEIIKFARFITVLKNKRIFDTRTRRIAEVTAIDSFLQSNSICKEFNTKYLTTLYDVWEYALKHKRLNGSRFSAGFIPEYKKDYNVPNNHSYNDTVGYFATINYDYEKPLNHKWQMSSNNYLKYGWETSKYKHSYHDDPNFGDNIYDYDLKSQKIHYMLEYNFGYYPNTRTYFEFGLFTTGNFNISKETKDKIKRSEVNIDQMSIRGNLVGKYYFSPQFYINISYNPAYLYYKNLEKHPDSDESYMEKFYFGQTLKVVMNYDIF